MPLDILSCFNLISNSLKLSELYELQGQDDPQYILKGLVIYWASHYYAFFRVFTDGDEEWLRVDDKLITKKGKWKDIVIESVNAMSTPTIILYEKYKKSVLVPDIQTMERNFKLDKYSLRDLVDITKENKRVAKYGDSVIDIVNMESSSGIPDASMQQDEEADSLTVEKRKTSYKRDGDEEKKDEPEKEIQSRVIGEDDWE